MPGMDGWQVCTEVRAFSDVPILILSALDSPGMVASALDAGADDYLVKPVPSGVLLAHLNNLNRRAIAEKKAQENCVGADFSFVRVMPLLSFLSFLREKREFNLALLLI